MSKLTLLPDDADLIVNSDLLGALNVRTTDLLQFPAGMLGFPECRRFALLRGGREGLFWLQSTEYSALVFLLVDPFTIDQSYSFDVQQVLNEPEHFTCASLDGRSYLLDILRFARLFE